MEAVIERCIFCLAKDDNISLVTTEVEKIIGNAVFNSPQTVKERLKGYKGREELVPRWTPEGPHLGQEKTMKRTDLWTFKNFYALDKN